MKSLPRIKLSKEKASISGKKIIRKKPSSNGWHTPADPDYREAVEKRAYEIYERRGCVHGYDQKDWFEAEKSLKSAAAEI